LAKFDLSLYARRGAELRIAELNHELESIYSAFPELRTPQAARGGRRAAAAAANATTAAGTASRAARRRSTMTAAQRRAVSQRMKRYWAERRKAKEK
jgi:hypothetical protein